MKLAHYLGIIRRNMTWWITYRFRQTSILRGKFGTSQQCVLRRWQKKVCYSSTELVKVRSMSCSSLYPQCSLSPLLAHSKGPVTMCWINNSSTFLLGSLRYKCLSTLHFWIVLNPITKRPHAIEVKARKTLELNIIKQFVIL